MLLSKYSLCNSKNSKFIKEQEASGLLNTLGLKIPLTKFLDLVLFCFKVKKMNEIINKFLLAGDACQKCI